MSTHEFVGLSPLLDPTLTLQAFVSLIRLKIGRGSFGELGNAVKLRESTNLALSYMGFATRNASALSPTHAQTMLN